VRFAQRGNERDFFLDAAPALEDLLRFGLVAPEIRSGGAGLYISEFFCG
jgi:hypothetical protein